MAKIHHATLKTAVATYLAFHLAGANEAEVKSEIAKDAKKFNVDAIQAIYDEIIKTPVPGAGDKGEKQPELNNPGKNNSDGKKGKGNAHIVISVFRDKDNFDKQYNIGDDVSHFDADRLAVLVNNKLVEVK